METIHTKTKIIAGCGAFKPGAKARTSFSSIVWVSLFLTLAFASTGYPVPVNILDPQYTTTVSDYTQNPNPAGNRIPFSRTQASNVPVSDSLYDSDDGSVVANANAGPFGISAQTAAYFFPNYSSVSSSSAFVESDVLFSPLTSQTTTINIQLTADLGHFTYESGEVSLLDVTSGNKVWNYGYGTFTDVDGAPSGINYGTTLVYSDFSSGPVTLMLNTDLNASDTYELSMLTGSQAAGDSESESIQLLSGLETAPEPSTFALIGLGSIALAMVRRRCSSSAVS